MSLISSYTVRDWFTFLPEFLITAGLFFRTRVCPQRMLLIFCFLSFLCIAADLYPIDIVHQYLLHHRRSKQKDFLSPPASPVVTLSLRLPMPSTPAPAVGIVSVIRQVTAATLSFSSHPACIGETGHIGLYRIIDCLQRSRHHSCRS